MSCFGVVVYRLDGRLLGISDSTSKQLFTMKTETFEKNTLRVCVGVGALLTLHVRKWDTMQEVQFKTGDLSVTRLLYSNHCFIPSLHDHQVKIRNTMSALQTHLPGMCTCMHLIGQHNTVHCWIMFHCSAEKVEPGSFFADDTVFPEAWRRRSGFLMQCWCYYISKCWNTMTN